ncbi:MAG: hypothetical protein KDC69_09195 [Flavobacteriaceae bacterium]|nr:hypothetical protein [Flavobacteriaceae bacterium]MCB0747474.1 hypothetical protein [Ignavibacteriota bacterium]
MAKQNNSKTNTGGSKQGGSSKQSKISDGRSGASGTKGHRTGTRPKGKN